MARSLVLELSDELYVALQQEAERAGISACQWVTTALERQIGSMRHSIERDPVIHHMVNMYDLPLIPVLDALRTNDTPEAFLDVLSSLVADGGPRSNLFALASDSTFREHWAVAKSLVV